MTRVYKDKWVWLFLVLGILTLVVALNAADNTKQIKASVDWIYRQMHMVKVQNAESIDDRESIHARLDRLEQVLRRLEQRR